jgi:hypothetical protein
MGNMGNMSNMSDKEKYPPPGMGMGGGQMPWAGAHNYGYGPLPPQQSSHMDRKGK